jgi:two-component system, OmpR family, sensor histidine kinase CiaH
VNWKAALQQARRFAVSVTGRLAASYLLVIMGMSLGYSVVLYNASVHELQRQVPPVDVIENYRGNGALEDGATVRISPGVIDDFFQARLREGRRVLLHRLVVLNLLTLVAGGGLSYYLARRTLQPIEANMEAQSQFVSDASHELRTPLTTLQTSNEVALRNPRLTLSQSKELIAQNIDEVTKLQALANGLLTLARPDGGQLATAPVSLQDVANDAMNRVVKQAQARDIAIDDKVSAIIVQANRQSLAQAVVVLLDNAIKYGPSGSTIYLSADKRSKRASISVRDEGPGIRPYDVRRIFDRFYRADQSRSTQHVAGNGIGLSLAKKLVEQQGGEIRVSSTVGKGSKFTISLPTA